MSTRLHALHAAGQSLWLDYIDRTMLATGDLARRIEEELLYPGQIRITVVRETRCVEYAK
mgnify:CR=1 FL=1